VATITDKLIRKVEIRLGGADWPLVVTHDVLIECERLTGKKMLAGGDVLRPTARLVRALLYLMLCRAGAAYTLGHVGKFITPANAEKVQGAILEAWAASMPDPEPEENGQRPSREEKFEAINAWAIARYDLGLSDQEWLDSTPRQIDELLKRKTLRSQFVEYLTAVIAATAANAPHWRTTQPREVNEFMKLHPFPEAPPKPVTGEMIMAAFAGYPKTKTT
jgi:hypothetical protein